MKRRPIERWRWSVKVALASTIAGVRDLGLFAAHAREQRRPLILGYHRVVDDYDASARTEMASMLISRAMFEHHLERLGREFRFVSLDEIGEHAESGVPFREPVAAITFDDGYRDVYEHAFPVLKRKGIPGAVFVVTDLVGQPFWQIHDRLYHLVAKAYAAWDDPRRELFGLLGDLHLPAAEVLSTRAATRNPLRTVDSLLSLSQADVDRLMTGLEAIVGNGCHDIPLSLTWPMLLEMRRNGITIGSHTRTHISLPAETRDVARAELEGSKHVLEMHLGEPISHFAYPGGQFTPADVDEIARAGYRFAYTACPHGDPRHPALTMERLLLWEGSSIDGAGRFSSAILDCQVHDLWPPSRRCERIHRR
jgi:peptidoglycan/xylan/chitin deacetylase (PgdA/CDA1 family)